METMYFLIERAIQQLSLVIFMFVKQIATACTGLAIVKHLQTEMCQSYSISIRPPA